MPELVRAFGAIAGEPAHADLMLVMVGAARKGRFASYRGKVESAVQDIGSAGARVVRTDFVPDSELAALYRKALCVVVPSLAEGFGLPALEAMASGAPLLLADIAPLREVCGPAAEYFTDPSDIGAKLGDLARDAPRREALRAAGFERLKLHGWDEGARRLLAFVESAGIPAK
jgi:glycosyltransferase involved in cell wall biosynthesis